MIDLEYVMQKALVTFAFVAVAAGAQAQVTFVDGTERPVEGKATPTDARSGKIKVRVFVSKRIELIFNTTYVFPDVPPDAPAPPAN